MSDRGVTIPAKIYLRTVEASIDKKSVNINELILAFDDKVVLDKSNPSDDQKLYKYLVIIPQLKTIGLIDHMGSLKIKNKCLCQTNSNANNFTSIIDNFTYFNNPPIKEANFSHNRIMFNTYGILKNYGKYIIINIK